MEQHYITKIEGHGTLHLNFDLNQARLNIEEGERLFEGLVLGNDYSHAPWIASRICGVCPTIHSIVATKAIESAFGVLISYESKQLRRLMLCAQTIQSHVLHLFFLALPDYMGLSSGLSIAQTYPSQFRVALELKRISDQILKVVGGRPVHPVTLCVGGFRQYPTRNNLAEIRDRLDEVIDEAHDLVALFDDLAYPSLENPTEYLHLEKSGCYAYYEGLATDTHENSFSAQYYENNIKEEIKSYSTAKFSTYRQKPFLVGALARVNTRHKYLRPKAKKILSHIKNPLPSANPFLNNLAQAIEVLHFTEEAYNIINNLLESTLPQTTKEKITVKEGVGYSIGEAPRGILYYRFKINKEGKVAEANIITPTSQNLSNLEADAQKLMEQTTQHPERDRQQLIEMLIRAYDPCITCSVH